MLPPRALPAGRLAGLGATRDFYRGLLSIALAMLFTGVASAQDSSTNFPRPAELVPAVEFWTRVYTEIGTDAGFLHDTENLSIVYETVDASASARQRRRTIQNRTAHYQEILTRLASGERGNLSTEEARVLSLWSADVSNAELRQAAGRLRFQLGQANRFRAGLIRSGRWRSYIEKVLDDRGLPRELKVLPHVESSFAPTAYSSAGAAGMWQFTRSTGLRYMRIDHIVDERRDPFMSTHAAAKLLQDNYSVIQTWPLALTAYNHGLGGMRRAVRQLGTDDIAAVVRDYKGRSFGFASRNFYVAFLAALEIDTNAERYFGPLDLDPPADFVLASVPDYVEARTLSRVLGMNLDEFRRFNPALADTVWAGDKFVPRGFELRLPRTAGAAPRTLLANLPAEDRYAAQRPDEYHRVRSGETLSEISEQYRVSLAALVRINGLSNRNFIRAGQLITLPVTGPSLPPTLALAAGGQGSGNGAYIVRRGDSIALIARAFGVEEAALSRANGVGNRNLIYPGQVLTIPASASAGAPPETPVVAARAPEAAAVQARAAEAEADDATVVAAAAVDVQAGEPAAAVAAAAVEPPVSESLNIGIADNEASRQPAASASTVGEEFVGPPIIVALSARQSGAAGEAPDGNALDSIQAALAADPSDYSVSDDGTIEVQARETLGHYADWLGIRTQRLRDLNGLPFTRAVMLGQRIKLDFSAVQASVFEQRRTSYQQELQESFFSAYRIANVEDHVVRSGESLWLLAQSTYLVPVWLLRQYNPDLDLDIVTPGMVVKFPRLEQI
ncbi:LysM peptidoglycan-binding domain-containing protein [Candidatus Rariloculus sp.]|uniref:LysM peptidoglycan-binding domain-containing protein n=1 Tax=Candidatus Rariloculus sp. TaxID=3101265 RepID=UPI003D0984CF